jgi:hypothetical protein
MMAIGYLYLASCHFVLRARIFKRFLEPRNRYQGMNSASLCRQAVRYNNPIPPRFLAPIDCLKIPAGIFKPLWSPGIDAKASIPPTYVAWRAGTITLFLLGA